MNENKLKRLFPNASKSFIKGNLDSGGKSSEPEQAIRHEPLAENKVKEGNTGKVYIRYTSVGKRLLDSDNPCSKYHTDALRYSKLIEGDSFNEAEITTTQRKCLKGEKPHTLIEIFDSI